MRNIILLSAAALVLAAGTARAQQPIDNPCAPPSQISPTVEETAWALWVAATCPVNQKTYPFVVWENWIEQDQMYPPNPATVLRVPNSLATRSGASHLLHASPLALAKHPRLKSVVPGLLGGADQSCNKAATPPTGQPNLIICEEVRLNGAAEDYIAGNALWNRPGQAVAASFSETIEFAKPSVEIKADWIELSSIGVDCKRLPHWLDKSVHIEISNGHCFALAGMHLISKLLDRWIWATFEPQNPVTNPDRCKVLGCTDRFGSTPPVTHGSHTLLTNRLKALMYAANLAPEWFNYRLDGVQVDFTRPKLLGNSVIEGENAGVPLTQSSCITCHSVSSIKSDGTDGITLLTSNPIGFPTPLPSPAWIRRDFVWSLFAACPNDAPQNCAR